MSKLLLQSLALVALLTSATAHAADRPTTPSPSIAPEAALAIGGASTFLAGYVPAVTFAMTTALGDHRHYPCTSAAFCLQPATTHADGVVLFAPVLGPVMLAADRGLRDDVLFAHQRPTPIQTTMLYVDAALQGAGVASVTSALVTALVRDHHVRRTGEITIVPSGTSSQPGLSVVGSF